MNVGSNPVLRQPTSSGKSGSAARISMGAFLDKPKVEKTTWTGEGSGLRFAVSQMQGWRVDMEDAHSAVVHVATDAASPFYNWSYFAVFDGHAGMRVAHHCAQNLLQTILETTELVEVAEELGKGVALNERLSELIRRGIRAGFLRLDERMRTQPAVYGDSERSGTTAVCALFSPSHLYIANLGDSRAILSKSGTAPIGTEDHKPFLPKERDRIVNAGGSVMIQRVNGSLAVSRALGDYEYKQVPGLAATEQLVSPEPDVYCHPRDAEKDEFILLACDGIFDVMTNVELAEFVRSRLRVTSDLSTVTVQILDSCLSKGSRDNMSVVLVTLPGAPPVSTNAQKQEVELQHQLVQRVQNIVSLCDKVEEVEAEYVLRILVNQDIPGVPPGAGIHAVRSQVEEILEKVKEQGSSAPPTDSRQP